MLIINSVDIGIRKMRFTAASRGKGGPGKKVPTYEIFYRATDT